MLNSLVSRVGMDPALVDDVFMVSFYVVTIAPSNWSSYSVLIALGMC